MRMAIWGKFTQSYVLHKFVKLDAIVKAKLLMNMRRFFLFTILILSTFLSIGQSLAEKLITIFPAEYSWKTVAHKVDSATHYEFMEMVPKEESLEKWTIIISTTVVRDLLTPNINEVIKIFSDAAIQESSKAIVTVLEKDDKSKNFWALYKVETSDFPRDSMPESQLTYVVQRKTSLFLTFVAIKEKELSKEFVAKWSKILKKSKLSFK